MIALPAMTAQEQRGWTKEQGGWRYYEDGMPLIGLCRIEEREYLFDAKGFLQTDNAGGEIVAGRRICFLNPDRDTARPATCYIASQARYRKQ